MSYSKIVRVLSVVLCVGFFAAQMTLSQTDNGRISTLAWSPDGSIIAVGYEKGKFELYEFTTGSLIFSDSSRDLINTITWSPDGLSIAVNYHTDHANAIDILDMSGNILHQISVDRYPNGIVSTVWSPIGNKLAGVVGIGSGGGTNYTLVIWDGSTGQISQEFVLRQPSSQIAWSPDSSIIAVTSFELFPSQLIDTTDGTILGNLDTEQVSSVAWSPDGAFIVTGTVDGQITIWDVNTMNLVSTFEVGYIADISWSPDGNYFATSTLNNRVDIWDVNQEIHVLTYTTAGLAGNVVWSPDGNQIIYSDYDQILTVNAPNTVACDHDIPASDTATLISTITSANGSGNPTTICLAQDSTYTFTTPVNYLNAVPYIMGDITIEGHNATITRSGTEAFRFFEVETGGKLTLNDLTLSNGDVTGETERAGALMNNGGETILNNVTFDGNVGATGGALDNEEGTVTITDSTFTNNDGGYGGAIDNDAGATMTITGSSFTTNQALFDGGAIHNDGGTLTVSSTIFTTNTAEDYGGAIDNDDGNLTINASTFTSNSSDGGGAIRNDSTTTLTINAGTAFNNNAANNLGWGGAIYNKSGTTLIINGSSFSSNTAADMGGAIRNQGNLTVNTGSSFDGNTAAEYGGAIYNTGGTANLTGVQITNNTATSKDAGGVYGNSSSSLTLTDSTLDGNDSGRRGGGIWSSGTASLTNVHITNNTAVIEGGGVYGSSSAAISAGNSCIGGNSSRAVYSASSNNQNFENNWWGATNGPSGSGSGSGDAVNSKIDYDPFITTSCPLP